MSKKPYKVRAKKYDEKLAIEGSFEDMVKLSIKPTKTKKMWKKIKTTEDIQAAKEALYGVRYYPKEGPPVAHDFIEEMAIGDSKSIEFVEVKVAVDGRLRIPQGIKYQSDEQIIASERFWYLVQES